MQPLRTKNASSTMAAIPRPSISRGWALGLVVTALSISTPCAAATRYVFAVFKGDSAANEKLSVYTSSDGLAFSLLSNTGYSGPTGVLRDPSLMKHTDGQYYVAYTVYSWDTESTSFAIAKSSDLIQWTFLVSIPAQVTGVKHTWAPEWFKDSDGSIHLIVSVDSPEWDFKPYVYTATNDTLTQWSAPRALGFGPNYIDTFIVTEKQTYHAFVKNETTKYIEHATASSLFGPWTFVGTGDWAGWGSGKEGPALFRLDDGSWRMFLDCYSGCGYLYTTSSDLTKWSATATVPGGLSGAVRHGTVLREETGSGGAPGTGGTSSTGGASNATTGGRSNPGSTVTGGTSTSPAGGASSLGGTGASAGGNTATAPLATGGLVSSGGAPAGGATSLGGTTNRVSSSANQGGSPSTGGRATSATGGYHGTRTATTGSSVANTGGAMPTGGAAAATSTTTKPTGGSPALVSDATNAPVSNNATSNDAGGCGCSLPGSPTRSHWILAALAGFAGIRRRRLRSRTR